MTTTRRRDEILHIAAELFRQCGYAGVAMDELGQAAGVTGPALYAHFHSKNHLLRAIFEQATALVRDSIERAASSEGTPFQRLELAVANYVELAVRHRQLAAVYIREVHSLPVEDRAPLVARRYLTGQWPSQDAAANNKPNDTINSYAGTYSFA